MIFSTCVHFDISSVLEFNKFLNFIINLKINWKIVSDLCITEKHLILKSKFLKFIKI